MIQTWLQGAMVLKEMLICQYASYILQLIYLRESDVLLLFYGHCC